MRRKSSGPGSGLPAGRLGFAVLAAIAAALMLASAAQATVGVEELEVSATGTGKGIIASGTKKAEILQTVVGSLPGSPDLECTYNGVATSGQCTTHFTDAGAYEQIAMQAIPSPGSEFVEWTEENVQFEAENCAKAPATLHSTADSTGVCFPYVEGPGEFEQITKISAQFADEPGEPLTVNIIGGVTGGPSTFMKSPGTIVSSPAGISECFAPGGLLPQCSKSYAANTEVTLTASPAVGFAFNSWTGCTTHEGLKCTVTMSAAKTVKASFVATPAFTVEKAGSGNGKVTATGISCDESCSKAVSAIKTGTSVTVKTTAAKGSEAAVLEGGTGSASGCSGTTCTFPISETSSVKVKFVPIPTKTLTVNLTGPAAYKGKVTGKELTAKNLIATAISCGSGCTTTTESFLSTGETELAATAAAGYAFKGWSVEGEAGTCTGTTTPCKLLTDANKTVSAEFK